MIRTQNPLRQWTTTRGRTIIKASRLNVDCYSVIDKQTLRRENGGGCVLMSEQQLLVYGVAHVTIVCAHIGCSVFSRYFVVATSGV